MKSRETKLAALIGGCAVIAMGVLGGTIVQSHAGTASVTSSEMSTGVTVTKKPGSTAAELPEATPAIKGPAALPPEEQGLPG